MALHNAKSNGKNLFQFYQEETQVLGKRELSLKSSILHEEFLNNLDLEYLPYFNTLTNEAVCIQAIPWLNHAEFGRIHFSEFARITANSGKITALYEWMVRNAVIYFKNLQSQPSSPKQLLLTFTLKQVEVPYFISRLSDLVKELQVDPQQLIFEIADDIESTNTEVLKHSLAILNQSGIQIAIGILLLGHFALQKITNLPINYLKIDNKLIKDIHTHLESKSILERILMIANSMEIGVLTEGVEKEEQKKLLQSLGCFVMQGAVFKS